jgi:hypothetical protein
MGSGVADGETFEALLEERLNRENAGGRHAQYEILNFGVGGYTDLHGLVAFETKGLSFAPNALFFVSHPAEMWRTPFHLAKKIREKIELPYDYLKDVVRRAGAEHETNANTAWKLLTPYCQEIISWVYHRIVEGCRQRSILPVWICLPAEVGERPSDPAAESIRLAEEAGFVVLNLCDVYANQNVESVRVAPWDLHPNAKGHQLIADRLYEALQEVRKTIPLDRSPRSDSLAEENSNQEGDRWKK